MYLYLTRLCFLLLSCFIVAATVGPSAFINLPTWLQRHFGEYVYLLILSVLLSFHYVFTSTDHCLNTYTYAAPLLVCVSLPTAYIKKVLEVQYEWCDRPRLHQSSNTDHSCLHYMSDSFYDWHCASPTSPTNDSHSESLVGRLGCDSGAGTSLHGL